MIQLVTLDLDNTLWEAEPVIYDAHRAMVAWLIEHVPGSEPLLHDDAWRPLRMQIVRERKEIAHHPSEIRKAMVRLLLAPLGLSSTQLEYAIEQSFNVFHEGRNRVRPYPEAVELLKYLTAHVPVIAVTNGNSDLKVIGIADYFQHVVSAESAGVAKPHPEIFLKALQLAGGVSANNALHVGDHIEEDIEAARRLGFKTIWVNESRKVTPLHCHPDQVVHSPAELLHAIKQWIPTPA